MFDFVADPSHLPEWYWSIVDLSSDPGSGPRPHANHRVTVDLEGRRFETVLEVVAFELNRHIGFRSRAGACHLDEVFVFESLGQATQVTVVPRRTFGVDVVDPNALVSLWRLREVVETRQLMGSAMRKVLPRPGVLSTHTRPW